MKGPYKNSTFPPGTKSIKGLYTEEYILVVRMYQLKLLQYVLLPFAPFDYKVDFFALFYIYYIYFHCILTITYTTFLLYFALCRLGFL